MENGFRSNPKYKEKYFKKKLFHEIQVLESPRQASRQIDRWTDRQGDKINGRDTDRQICCRRWWYYDVIPIWPSSEEEAVKVFLEGGVPLTCHLLSFPRVEGWESWRQLRRMLRCFSCGLVQFLYIRTGLRASHFICWSKLLNAVKWFWTHGFNSHFEFLKSHENIFRCSKQPVPNSLVQASDKVVPVLGKIVVPWGSVFRKSRAFSKNA